MKPTHPFVAILCLIALGCGESAPTEPEGPGSTTRSDIPVGDLPPIPVPATLGDVQRTRSDSVNTTVALLATDFNPAVVRIEGRWVVERVARWGGVNACRYTLYNQQANSASLRFPEIRVACAAPFYWEYVEYRNRGPRMHSWLGDNPQRVTLVETGSISEPPSTLQGIDIVVEYTGSQSSGTVLDPRTGCRVAGAGTNPLPCNWTERTLASVAPNAISNAVYLRRDVFWEKAGNSQIYSNSSAVQITQSFTRSWTAGTDSVSAESFTRSTTAGVGASVPIGAVTAKASVSATLSQTFGTSVTVSSATSASETYSVTVAGNQSAVFEVWNLIEQYTFTNADGTLYEDPAYTFSLPSLTRSAAISTAFVSTEFPS